jgi:TonB-dependent SusC/RagA subfamily outer membrane receptor
MSSAHARRPLGWLLGCVAACSHPHAIGQGGTAATPSAATPSSVVTAEEIERVPGRSIEQILMDRFPGVTVSRTSDGTIAVRVRGTTSIESSNEPLYVIDGIPIVPGPGGGLTGINPHDIASIEVVKDPAGTALYGVRGANGVIIIKTKQPDQ